jgi:hypothetical protein
MSSVSVLNSSFPRLMAAPTANSLRQLPYILYILDSNSELSKVEVEAKVVLRLTSDVMTDE